MDSVYLDVGPRDFLTINFLFVISAFTFLISLAWNTAVQHLFSFSRFKNRPIIYAFIVTIMGMILINAYHYYSLQKIEDTKK